MMDALLLAVVIFSVQLLVVIAVAAVAEALARVTDARLRFNYWRGVALACLALPLSAIVGPEPSSFGIAGLTFLAASLEGVASFANFASAASSAYTAPIQSPSIVPAARTIAWSLLCAGVLARLAWLCVGAVRLRQLRQRSRPAATAITPDLETIRYAVAPHAEFRVSRDIAQPASFGLRHPIVLLPERFFTLDPQAQRTVACHELLHVARRDWPWIVVEEIARALFWFHPAVWWLVERIQESREQLVDRLVITRIPSKRAYMSALLAFAGGHHRPATLATAFLRRRHLRSRLQKLVKEPVMSQRRFVATAVVLMSMMASAITATVMALPFNAAQQVVDGKDPGVTLPKVVTKVNPQYTPEALQARIEGSMKLTGVVRTDGTTGDIEVTESLDKEHGLDKQAIDAFKQWRFEAGQKDGKAVPVRVTIEMRFSLK